MFALDWKLPATTALRILRNLVLRSWSANTAFKTPAAYSSEKCAASIKQVVTSKKTF